jgi:hypothetical protein
MAIQPYIKGDTMPLKQRFEVTPERTLTVQAYDSSVMQIPALAVPVAWLLQVYATLDGQPNSLTPEQLLEDMRTVFVRHTDLVPSQDCQHINQHETYEYELTLRDELGRLSNETLIATDDDHAREEAGYEYEEECVAVKRGARLPDPKPWRGWPDKHTD